MRHGEEALRSTSWRQNFIAPSPMPLISMSSQRVSKSYACWTTSRSCGLVLLLIWKLRHVTGILQTGFSSGALRNTCGSRRLKRCRDCWIPTTTPPGSRLAGWNGPANIVVHKRSHQKISWKCGRSTSCVSGWSTRHAVSTWRSTQQRVPVTKADGSGSRILASCLRPAYISCSNLNIRALYSTRPSQESTTTAWKLAKLRIARRSKCQL